MRGSFRLSIDYLYSLTVPSNRASDSKGNQQNENKRGDSKEK